MRKIQNALKKSTFEGLRVYLEDIKKLENILCGYGLKVTYSDQEYEYVHITELMEHSKKRLKRLKVNARTVDKSSSLDKEVVVDFDGGAVTLIGDTSVLNAYDSVQEFLSKKTNPFYKFLDTSTLLLLGFCSLAFSYLMGSSDHSDNKTINYVQGIFSDASILLFGIACLVMVYRNYYVTVILEDTDESSFVKKHFGNIVSSVLTALIVALLHKYFGVLGC